MKFLYATDLHGKEKHYENVFNFAIENEINLIHLGADILPKGNDIFNTQKKFIKGFLKNFYTTCKRNDIEILTSFGNDDLYVWKENFRKYGKLLDEMKYFNYGEYDFKSYPYVLDYPFGLKAACKLDYSGWKCNEPYIGTPCDFDKNGYYIINDVEKYFRERTTIEEDLDKINVDNKTIMSIHQPPHGLELDVCSNGKRVGSKSIYKWIEKTQPLLVLCGHIHESYSITGVWKTNIGKTVIIQPGQANWVEMSTTMVKIEILNDDIIASLIRK